MTHEIIRIRWPFESHVHGRQGDLLKKVAPMTARQFWGAIFEPNLITPITTADHGRSYLQEIRDATPDHPDFKPYVLLYMTDTIDPNAVSNALADGVFIGGKFYPFGATTNSQSGIVDVRNLWTRGTRQFDLMRAFDANKKVKQLHCEVNFDLQGNELDPYAKEPYFFREIMPRLLDAHPDGKWSCEHLSCKEGAAFLRRFGGPHLGCSITPHHMLYDRRDMFRGGLRPHFFCLPVIKTNPHKIAVTRLATSGLPFVWDGTDSAPHDRRKKECDCCSGGVFTAHAAVEFYAQAFANADALDWRFEAFMSLNGPAFYDLPVSEKYIELRRAPWTVNRLLHYSDNPRDIIHPHGFERQAQKRPVLDFQLAA